VDGVAAALERRGYPDAHGQGPLGPFRGAGTGSPRGSSIRSKRDYIAIHELRDAESVQAQLASWIDDYNRQAPHSALGVRSPADYRVLISTSSELTSPSVWSIGERMNTRSGASTGRRVSRWVASCSLRDFETSSVCERSLPSC
jgi:Integrase core domain